MKKRLFSFLLAAVTAAVVGVGSFGALSAPMVVNAEEFDDDEYVYYEEYTYYYDDDDDDHRQEHWDPVPVQEEYYAYVYGSIQNNSIYTGASTAANASVYTNASQASIEVRWSSSNSSVASVSGCGNSAVVTGINPGTAVITCSVYLEGQYADSESISVEVKQATPTTVSVNGISISTTYVSMQAGQTQRISATPTPSNANNRGITWSTSNANVATVQQDGTITAVCGGQCTITARTNEGGFCANCTVAVNGGGTAAVSNVAVNPSSVTLAINQYMYITPTVFPANAANKSVTWASSNPAVATVSSDGKVQGVAAGQAVITCRTNDQGKTATTIVNVGNAVAGAAGVPAAPVTSSNTRSPQLCCDTVNQILAAPKNGTVTINGIQPMAYDNHVQAAMNMRPDVTLVCTFPFQGHNFKLTLPKGYQFTKYLDQQNYVEWLQLCALKDGPVCQMLN